VLDNEEKDAMDMPNGDNGTTAYVMQTQQSMDSVTVSSKKNVDTGLLHRRDEELMHTSTNGQQLETKHAGFVSIGDTKSRRSRTPSPIRDSDASILIEKTSGCSCFGWFGKKKKRKNKNIGLAQQELR